MTQAGPSARRFAAGFPHGTGPVAWEDEAFRRDADIWIFDLDDTLYPRASGLREQMNARILHLIEESTGYAPDRALALHRDYVARYGTSLVGMARHHGVAPETFLSFVHEIDLSPIQADAPLAAALAALPGRRIVFTNSARHHTERILERLGVGSLFEAVCSIESCGFIGKPDRVASEILCADFGIDPDRAVMFDDRTVNLKAPFDLGMRTVLVDCEGQAASAPHIHRSTDNLSLFLSSLFPQGTPLPSADGANRSVEEIP